MNSPIWDVRDCAPVYTPDQIGVLDAAGKSVVGCWDRLVRFEQTADILDAICDGKFFALDFEGMIREIADNDARQ